MRLILLSVFLLTNLSAQNVTVYPDANKPATAPAATSATEAPASPPAATMAPATPADATGTEAPAIPGETQYTVVSGDSLWKIHRKFRVTIESIMTLNHLPNDKLKIGLVLRIPPPLELKAKPTDKDKKATTDSHKKTDETKPVAAIPVAPPPPPPTLQERFTNEIKQIASNKIPYNHEWIPPGEQESWTMDCSNTTRWLYKKVEGVNIPRTASDQYDQLYKDGKAWRAPRTGEVVDADFLQRNLKTGDLLFWENTYKPDRNPPVTHVALYLGKDDQGQMLMAASQSSHGLYNAAGNGPDVYVFDPNAPTGGYNTGFFGMTHVKGAFVGFGRPAEANDAAVNTPVINPNTPAVTPDKVPTTIKAPN